MDMIRLHRFDVVQKRKIWMDRDLVEKIYKDHASQPYFEHLTNYLTAYFRFNLVLLFFVFC
jgi:nucleoside diphosphate kinase